MGGFQGASENDRLARQRTLREASKRLARVTREVLEQGYSRWRREALREALVAYEQAERDA